MSQMLRFGMTKPTQQHLPIKHKKCLRRYSPAILPSDVWFLMLQSYFQNLISARIFEDMLPWSTLYLGNLQRPNRRTCGKGNLPKIPLAWVGELFWPDTIFLEGYYLRNQCLSPGKSLYFTGSPPWKCIQNEVFAFIFSHRVTGNAYKTAFGDYIFCALRIMKDPPIEWFESVFSQGSGISKPPVLRSHDS